MDGGVVGLTLMEDEARPTGVDGDESHGWMITAPSKHGGVVCTLVGEKQTGENDPRLFGPFQGNTTMGRHTPGPRIAGKIGDAIDEAIGTVGRTLSAPLRAAGGLRRGRVKRAAPGSRAGIESVPDLNVPPPTGQVALQCMDYGLEQIEVRQYTNVDTYFADPRPEWAAVRWVNVDGLHPYVVHRFMKAYGLHTLAAEDVLHVHQRPKVEPFENDLFIVTRMLTMEKPGLKAEQISFFYRPGLLISFQEDAGDVWEPIRQRIKKPESRHRRQDASYLLYTLLDAIVDQCFPILEQFGDALEEMEDEIVHRPSPSVVQRLHGIKRQLVQLRRVLWPMRESLSDLQDEAYQTIHPVTRTYLRDVTDHAIQVIDMIETYREMAGGLTDLYMSAVSNRMNETMKVLTIIATIFIPITFLAGVYGMNFEHQPELHWRWGYPVFWAICGVTTIGLLWFFKRKGWLGR